MTHAADDNARWKGWLRFRISTLLLLLTVFSVVMAVWAVVVRPYRDQMEAMAKLRKAFANSAVEEELRVDGPSWHRWLVGKMLGEEQYIQVVSLDLTMSGATREQLELIANLKFLERLSLDRTEADDATMASLSRLTRLKSLSLSYTPVTDEGIESLANHPSLEELFLTGTAVSDASIPPITSISSLGQLYVRWSKFTKEGTASLRAARPDCDIHSHYLVSSR